MTVALLDRLAPKVRALLGVGEDEFPLAACSRRHLGGRTADRRRAPRAAALPSLSSATERYFEDHEMDGLTIVDHPLVQHKLTLLRDRNSSIQLFRTVVREMATCFATR